MGWTGGGEILAAVWPTIEGFVEDEIKRIFIYIALINALEDQDADTLGEVVYCTNDQVDPILIGILREMGHLDEEQEDD